MGSHKGPPRCSMSLMRVTLSPVDIALVVETTQFQHTMKSLSSFLGWGSLSSTPSPLAGVDCEVRQNEGLIC